MSRRYTICRTCAKSGLVYDLTENRAAAARHLAWGHELAEVDPWKTPAAPATATDAGGGSVTP